MWLDINVYTRAIMIMGAIRFSVITSAEPLLATMCTAVRQLLPFWVTASTLVSAGRQLRSSFIVYDTYRQLYDYNISFILIFYMWLDINVYTHAIMIMGVIRFSVITSAERLLATKCTAVSLSTSSSIRASTLLSSGRQLRSSFIRYKIWRQLYRYNISYILLFYRWLYINVYTHALMIMWVVNFSKITVGERPSATQCTAPLLSVIHRDNCITIILVLYWYSICDFTLMYMHMLSW